MSQAAKSQRFVQAYLLDDLDDVLSALKEMGAEHPGFKVCDAIVGATLLRRGKAVADTVREKLRLAQDPPPENVSLLTLLLIAAVKYAVTTRSGDVGRSLRALRELVRPDDGVELQAQLLWCEASVVWSQGELARAHKLMAQVCALPVPRGSGLWHNLRLALCTTGMHANDFTGVDSALAEMSSSPPADEWLREEIDLRRLRLLSVRGQAREGLALLERVPRPKSADGLTRMHSYRVTLLLSTGRFAEAWAAIDAAGGELDGPYSEFLRAKVCRSRGDVAGVREHVRRALASPQTRANSILDNSLFLIAAELQAGQTRSARQLLKMVDPEQADADNAILWAWLSLLEEDLPNAARQFQRMLDLKDRRVIREQLRGAGGLTAGQIAVLWTLADDLDAAAEAPAPKPAVAPAALAGGGGDRAELLGDSPAIAGVRASIERFAGLAETVLVTGETGTGKELVARLLHDRSPRSAEPFIAVNCGGISETLIESELFGHVKGAFTGATGDHDGLFLAAGEGTLFLDEITSMSPRLQAALLRVLENGEIRPVGASRSRKVKARVIAASNQPLQPLAERGEFRPDLYYRLARLHIELPPLRERVADIAPLARHFLGRFPGYGDVTIDDGLLRALERHPWPGNVRELENEMRRMAVLAAGRGTLDASLFGPAAAVAPGAELPEPKPAAGPREQPVPVYDKLKLLRRLFAERRELTRAEAVRLLGCAPNTATRYLRALEQEGLIERVHTSAALRTSYFTIRRQEDGKGGLGPSEK